ncbi:MAG: flagellar biosynthesis protein FlhF [endosymbiont of Galathealinum brachiosum]|uniref:Flagellar biosynthesis protein FlhF n=1 Tax=endosymbiont of Galathealinum brachiosum TaxID=2200906 RepID=A0A370D8B4_9GAMM|nr:MAG: flagellar biosynthesis protein FlhF [endosymbiont of Galathealinum brachiosum]
MQVKRFVADDMRTAMRLVKAEIGSDAVILSNRVVDGKIEILAARDYDESLINKALDQTLIESKPNSAAAYYERAAAEREIQQSELNSVDAPDTINHISELAEQQAPAQQVAPVEEVVTTEAVAELTEDTAHQAAGLYQPPVQMQPPFTDSMVEMRDELKSLRAMIENQHVLGEWKEMATRHPLRVSLYKRLTEMGLSQDVCKYLAKGLDDSIDVEQAMQAALKQLVHQIPIAGDDILNQGGVFAMVGPTGVGKTTTIAKLAARFAMQHGQRHVALISTDTYRIGAHEQLVTYGRLLGVPVHSANDAQELQQLLHKLHDKKLILIDTAGMSQRDIDISQQLAHLSHPSSMIKPYLVLSANAQISTLDEVISAFKKASPAGCILTKLDEAASLGGVLSAIIKHRLPVAYVSNGQKVPEDIEPARARELVDDTLAHSKRYKQSIDDEFMAVAFTNAIGHAPL